MKGIFNIKIDLVAIGHLYTFFMVKMATNANVNAVINYFRYFVHLLVGLEYLHGQGVIHKDILLKSV